MEEYLIEVANQVPRGIIPGVKSRDARPQGSSALGGWAPIGESGDPIFQFRNEG